MRLLCSKYFRNALEAESAVGTEPRWGNSEFEKFAGHERESRREEEGYMPGDFLRNNRAWGNMIGLFLLVRAQPNLLVYLLAKRE